MSLVLVSEEEIGWRGYMLTRLIDAGVLRPVLASALIWGLWHVPLVLAGVCAAGPFDGAMKGARAMLWVGESGVLTTLALIAAAASSRVGGGWSSALCPSARKLRLRPPPSPKDAHDPEAHRTGEMKSHLGSVATTCHSSMSIMLAGTRRFATVFLRGQRTSRREPVRKSRCGTVLKAWRSRVRHGTMGAKEARE